MKKLMTMIAAVATAFGLYADATLNEAFNATNETLGVYTPATPGWATYSGAGDTLNIVGETKEEQMLEIGTGNAELTRNAASDGKAWTIDDSTGLYLDTVIDFKSQALDDIPTNNVTASDKIGIFVLDTSALEDATAPGTTNLFVMAGYGAEGAALYDIGEVDAAWYANPKKVTIKAYSDVFNGDAVRSGFLVSVADVDATKATLKMVSKVYPIVDGAVVWTDAKTSTDYLGLEGTGITLAAKVAKWAKPGTAGRRLFFSMAAGTVNNGSLTSVGFRGNAKISTVGFNEAMADFFPADSFSMTVACDESVSFNVTTVGVEYDSEAGTLVAPENSMSVTITTTSEKDIVEVFAGTTKATKVGDSWTFSFVDNATLTITGSDAAAWIDETPFKSLFGNAGAIAYVNANGGTLKLATGVVATEALNFAGENEIVLDLNGKAITFDSEEGYAETISNNGLLTITDSLGGGSVAAGTGNNAVSVGNYGTLTIEKGIFLGGIYNEGTLAITGGKFDVAIENDERATIVTTGGAFNDDVFAQDAIPGVNYENYEAVAGTVELAGYWKVQEIQIVKGTVIFICGETETTNDTWDVGTTITFPPIAETDTTIGKGWFYDQAFQRPAEGATVVEGEQKFYAKVVAAVAKVGSEKFETVEAAFAKVQALEKAGTYPITVTALVANLAVTDPNTKETITLGKDAVITITDTDWTFVGTVSGEVTLAAGKSITVPEGSALTVKAPAGDYKVVTTPGESVVTYTVVAIQYATLTVATVENLTISVTNAAGEVQNTGAKFDKDLATVLYVTRTPASGYELDGYVATETITMSADVTVTGAVKSAAQPVNPGEEKQYDDPQKAADAAKAINDNKEASINVPPEAADNKTAYLARVAAKVIEGNKVVVDIAAENEATFKGELDTEMKKTAVAAALTDATATKATIATVPGFYYWIEGGVEVGTINQNGTAKIGTGSTVELTKPTLEAAATAGKAFYKLAVGVKAP